MIASQTITSEDHIERCEHWYQRASGSIVCCKCGWVKERIITSEQKHLVLRHNEIKYSLGSEIGNRLERLKMKNRRLPLLNYHIRIDSEKFQMKRFYYIQLFNLSLVQKENVYTMIKKHLHKMTNSVVFGAMALYVNGVCLFEIIEKMVERGHNVNTRLINLCMRKYGYRPPVFPSESYVVYYLDKLKVKCSELKLKIMKNVSKKIFEIKGGAPHTAAITAIFLVLQQQKHLTRKSFAEMLGIKKELIKFVLKLIEKQRNNIIAGIRKDLKQIGELYHE